MNLSLSSLQPERWQDSKPANSVSPSAEQKRIVARVEALLRQCDALEAQLHQTRTLGAHLLESTLHHHLAA